MNPIVIIGSGLAGYTLARELRKLDPAAPLLIITRDDGAYYSKPMLSNAFAARKTPADLATAAGAMAEQLKVKVLPYTAVSAIDTEAKQVTAASGVFGYSKLVLALGADPIRLPLEGDAAGEVLSVNDLADYARFRSILSSGKRVVILGAGLIGCEFANDLAANGYRIDVVDPNAWPLSRLLPQAAGDALSGALADCGVRWHWGCSAKIVERTAGALRVLLSNGVELHADAVLSAVGLRPRMGLALEAGIATGRGILADDHLLTSAPDVYALGDCAEVQGLHLPFVLPIMHSARALAQTLAGTLTPVLYPAMPVAVKTPALPLTVAPPRAGVAGEWRVELSGRDVAALFVDPTGALQGFALAGAANARKQALVKQLPALLVTNTAQA